jgi:methionine synthase II (cobalamin-independent)
MSSKLHRNPPFRAEHLGSLLRTEKLLHTRHAWEAGKESDATLKAVEDQDVKEIVKIQQDIGFRKPYSQCNP